MREEIFRQKSLDKVKSPENLNDYIQVYNPGMWLFIVSVIILLAGACVWGIFGHVDSTMEVSVQAESGTLVCTISEEGISSVKTGMIVRFDDFEAVITGISKDGSGYLCTLQTNRSAPDGLYEGKVILESYKPLSFVMN